MSILIRTLIGLCLIFACYEAYSYKEQADKRIDAEISKTLAEDLSNPGVGSLSHALTLVVQKAKELDSGDQDPDTLESFKPPVKGERAVEDVLRNFPLSE